MYNRRLVFTFGLLNGLFAAGYGVMFTLLDDFRDRYGISESSLGAVVAIGFFASFAAQVFFAPLADRGHARRLVNVGMSFNLVGLLTMAFGKTILLLLLGRLLMGIGTGMGVPAIRRIVILADPDNLGSNIGRLLAADVAGFAAGPAISAVLVGPLGIAAPFLFIAVVTVACYPVVARAHVDETSTADRPQARFAFDLLRSRTYVGALMFGSAVFLMVGTFDALWVLVLDDLHTADWIANLGITLFALPLIFFGSTGGRLAQRVGPFRVCTVGLLGGAAFMFSYGRLPTGLAMFAVAMVHALNDGVSVASSGVAVGVVAPKERMAGAQGLLGGAQTLTGGIAALVAGELYQNHGRAAAYTTCAVLMAVFVLIGVLCVGKEWGARPDQDDVAEAAAGALAHQS
ncbi:MAG: putative major facilitator superfamily transporter [Ilumatobacteraceae bacterium]|nr:putative major facilitator superfamily transporter [Ilumatobacteraceae bacterium]